MKRDRGDTAWYKDLRVRDDGLRGRGGGLLCQDNGLQRADDRLPLLDHGIQRPETLVCWSGTVVFWSGKVGLWKVDGGVLACYQRHIAASVVQRPRDGAEVKGDSSRNFSTKDGPACNM